LPRADVLRYEKAAAALIFLEYGHSFESRGYSGKLFEYLILGRPILDIGPSEDSLSAELILKAKAGLICGTELKTIKAGILQVLEDNCQGADSTFAAQFNREIQVKKFARFLEKKIHDFK